MRISVECCGIAVIGPLVDIYGKSTKEILKALNLRGLGLALDWVCGLVKQAFDWTFLLNTVHGSRCRHVALDLVTLGQTNRQINLSPCQGDISIRNCCAI